MKGARKNIPIEYIKWLNMKSSDWKPDYPLPSDINKLVTSSLYSDQRGLCVYCGRKLDTSYKGDTFHIEHFRPQKKYEELKCQYENLFLSCGQLEKNKGRSEICGTHKADWFEEHYIIEPIYPECINRFKFSLNGYIFPKNNDDVQAQKMIDILNLNHSELKKDREKILYLLDSEKFDIGILYDYNNNCAENLAHVVYNYIGKTLP